MSSISILQIAPAVIESGGTTSLPVNIGGQTICAFEFPASFEGATVTFQAASTENGTYRTVKDPSTGSDVTVTAGANAYVPVHPADFTGIAFLKIVSASSVAANRTINLMVRPLS